jgi:hypothetical protein
MNVTDQLSLPAHECNDIYQAIHHGFDKSAGDALTEFSLC